MFINNRAMLGTRLAKTHCALSIASQYSRSTALKARSFDTFSANMSVAELLKQTKLVDVFTAPSKVCSFDHDVPAGTVLEALSALKILSAPVMVRPDHVEGPGRVHYSSREVPLKGLMGFVGVSDILEGLLKGFPEGEEALRELTGDDVDALCTGLCDNPVSALFGDGPGASALAVLTNAGQCHDWGIKGDLNAPLLSVIRSGFLHAQPSTAAAHRPLQMRVTHRLAVFDCREAADDGSPHLVGVFSQSDAVRFLAEHADKLGPLAGRTLADLGLALAHATLAPSAAAVVDAAVHGQPPAAAGRHRQLLCVPNGMLTLEAFKRMFHSNVSALGVLAPDGRLVGNLSASDLRCLAPGLFSELLAPLEVFLADRPLLYEIVAATGSLPGLTVEEPVTEPPAGPPPALGQEADKKAAAAAGAAAGGGDASATGAAGTTAAGGGSRLSRRPVYGRVEPAGPPFGLLCCKPESTFAEVLEMVALERVHRAYVVDEGCRPVGVVTLTDMLQLVSEACG